MVTTMAMEDVSVCPQLLAVVWCVSPGVRKDAGLRRQAEFIDKLKPGQIWENVLVVVKQVAAGATNNPQSVNPGYDGRGALAAAQDFAAPDAAIKVAIAIAAIATNPSPSMPSLPSAPSLPSQPPPRTVPRCRWSATGLWVTSPSPHSRRR